MLLAQDTYEIHELSCPLEPREEELLFELLVVVLDEPADDPRPTREGLGWHLLTSTHPPEALLVDEQHPAQDAMLAHEILGGRDLLLSLLSPRILRARRTPGGCGRTSSQHPARADAGRCHQQGSP